MTEVFEHNPDDHEDPASGPTSLMGLVGALLLVAILLGITALWYNVKAEEVHTQVVAQPRREVQDMRKSQLALLQREPQWVTRQGETGEVRALVVPIERAMEIVVAENAK